MQNPLYNSPAMLKDFLLKNNLAMQKKFGQNFLIDENIRRKLVSLLELDKTKTIWEIGAGLGSMTELLLQSGSNVIAFEIDKGFIKFLSENFSNKKNFKLVTGDVLKTWKVQAKEQLPDYFFGNLPYNIAATLILDTIEIGSIFRKCLITVQSEVADRLSAKVGENYSVASVLVQAFYTVKTVQTIGNSAFWPMPKITSKAVLLERTETYSNQIKNNEKLFFSLVKGLFSSRRKTLKNNLVKWLKVQNMDLNIIDKILSADMQMRRAETLALQDFIDLTNSILSYKN